MVIWSPDPAADWFAAAVPELPEKPNVPSGGVRPLLAWEVIGAGTAPGLDCVGVQLDWLGAVCEVPPPGCVPEGVGQVTARPPPGVVCPVAAFGHVVPLAGV